MKGLVTTSSPGPQPSWRTPRWSAAVPLETATASSTPRKSAKARSKRSPIGPSESRPERSTSSTSSSSRSPISGLASGIGSKSLIAAPPHWNAYSSESTSACQEASITFPDTPVVPHSRSPSAESSRTRVTASVPRSWSRIRTL